MLRTNLSIFFPSLRSSGSVAKAHFSPCSNARTYTFVLHILHQYAALIKRVTCRRSYFWIYFSPASIRPIIFLFYFLNLRSLSTRLQDNCIKFRNKILSHLWEIRIFVNLWGRRELKGRGHRPFSHIVDLHPFLVPLFLELFHSADIRLRYVTLHTGLMARQIRF